MPKMMEMTPDTSPRGLMAQENGNGHVLVGSLGEYQNNKELLKGRRILVISPHADDETFGCAGTIAKAKSLGSEVFIIYVSVGDLAHYSTENGHVCSDVRVSEIEAASRAMGIDGYTILFRDSRTHMRLDAMPRRDLIAKIERDSELAIDRVRPDILMLPGVSFNQDHEAVFRAGFAACRPHLHVDKPFVSLVLTYDQPQLGWRSEPFQPNFYVDISDFLELKLKAHACHQSQIRPDPHHASLENLERLARLRGSEVAVTAAEAFYCHRCVA